MHEARDNAPAAIKAALRATLRAQRLEMPSAAAAIQAAAICDHLQGWLRARAARIAPVPLCVGSYAATHGEIDLGALPGLLPDVVFGLPVIAAQGRTMAFRPWVGQALKPNRFGINEPVVAANAATLLPMQPTTVILLPCLAVDAGGFRLGYGGGYYDRFLAEHAVVTVGVVGQNFLRDNLPHESHDQVLHWVVTEAGVRSLPLAELPPRRSGG